MTVPWFTRMRPVAPLSSRQQQSQLLLSHGLEDVGDDGIVPSTPTLFVPRRSDGFGEAVSSPHVPTSGRFTFNESSGLQSTSLSGSAVAGESSEVVPEQTLETSLLDDNSMRRRLWMWVFNNGFYCFRYWTQRAHYPATVFATRGYTRQRGTKFVVCASCSARWYVIFNLTCQHLCFGYVNWVSQNENLLRHFTFVIFLKHYLSWHHGDCTSCHTTCSLFSYNYLQDNNHYSVS